MIAIAIDGPGGAGKSTISKEVAKRAGIVYVDTGALYRTVGYYANMSGLSVEDAKDSEKMTPLLSDIKVELVYENGTQHVYLNGEDLGDKIRRPEMSMYASAVSSVPSVRAFLLETQKDMARKQSVIMDGRDIGTVILPNADIKVFLTASNEARAQRRYNELVAKGMDVRFEDVLAELITRDKADSGRDIAPAVPAEDAIIFDNSNYTFEESVEYIMSLINQKIGG